MTYEQKQDLRLFGGVILFFLVVFLGTALPTHCQTFVKPISTKEKPKTHSQLHTSEDEWEDNIRIKFVKFTSRDDDLLYFTITRKYELRQQSLAYDNRTIVDATYGGINKLISDQCYMVIYCKEHLMAYVFSKIDCKSIGGKK